MSVKKKPAKGYSLLFGTIILLMLFGAMCLLVYADKLAPLDEGPSITVTCAPGTTMQDDGSCLRVDR